MRTTLNIATPILEELREIRSKEGGSLGQVVSTLLAEALKRRQTGEDQSDFEWSSKPMGARVDLSDKEIVGAILNGDPPDSDPP